MLNPHHPLTKAQRAQGKFEQQLPTHALLSRDNNIALAQVGQSLILLHGMIEPENPHNHGRHLTRAFIIALSYANQLNVNLAERVGTTRSKILSGLAREFATKSNPDIKAGSHSATALREAALTMIAVSLDGTYPHLASMASNFFARPEHARRNGRLIVEDALVTLTQQMLVAFGFIQRRDYTTPRFNLEKAMSREYKARIQAAHPFPVTA